MIAALSFAASALVGAALVSAQAAINWQYVSFDISTTLINQVPSKCASDCSKTVETAYLCSVSVDLISGLICRTNTTRLPKFTRASALDTPPMPMVARLASVAMMLVHSANSSLPPRLSVPRLRRCVHSSALSINVLRAILLASAVRLISRIFTTAHPATAPTTIPTRPCSPIFRLFRNLARPKAMPARINLSPLALSPLPPVKVSSPPLFPTDLC